MKKIKLLFLVIIIASLMSCNNSSIILSDNNMIIIKIIENPSSYRYTVTDSNIEWEFSSTVQHSLGDKVYIYIP